MKKLLLISATIVVTMLFCAGCGGDSSSSSEITLGGDTSLVGTWSRSSGVCYNERGIDEITMGEDGATTYSSANCTYVGTWVANDGTFTLTPVKSNCDFSGTFSKSYEVGDTMLITLDIMCTEYWSKLLI